MKTPKWMRAKSKTENTLAIIILIVGILIAIFIPIRTLWLTDDNTLDTEEYGFTVFEKT